MSSLPLQVLSLLISNPGSLAYHLVISFSLLAALLAVLNQQRTAFSPEMRRLDRRMSLGLAALLTLRLLLFLAAGLAWQGTLDAVLVLPVLERSVDLLSLLIIAWLWVFPRPAAVADLAVALVACLALGMTFISLAGGFDLAGQRPYNTSAFDLYTQIAALCLASLAVILLVIRRPAGWPIGLVMLSILAAGHALQLLYPIAGDFPASVRLAQMIAFPLLIALPYRFTFLEQGTRAVIEDLPDQAGESDLVEEMPPLQGHSLAGGASLAKWLSEIDPQEVGQVLSAALAQELQADLCLCLWPPDGQDQLLLSDGYDIVHRHALPDAVLPKSALPVLAGLFDQPHSLRLPANSHVPDLIELARALGFDHAGSLLAQPVMNASGAVRLQVVLLSPVNSHRWSPAEEGRLAALVGPLAHILQRNRQMDAA